MLTAKNEKDLEKGKLVILYEPEARWEKCNGFSKNKNVTNKLVCPRIVRAVTESVCDQN